MPTITQSPAPVPPPQDTAARPAWWLRAISCLPLPVLYAIGVVVAFVLRRILRYRVGIARANLRSCLPALRAREIDAIVNRYYRNLAQVAMEFLKGATLSADELRRRVRFANLPLARAEIEQGRSVLLLAAHQCNWEWSLQAVTLGLGVPLDAAYKPLHSEAADRELLAMRSRFGARMVAAKRLVREVARRRHELHAICLMADQMPLSSRSRHWLDFLGRDTAFYPGPAQIALSTGYAAFFVAMRRTARGHYELEFQPVAAAGVGLDPEQFTARYAQRVEQQILAHPADWAWTHRRWKHARVVT